MSGRLKASREEGEDSGKDVVAFDRRMSPE